MTSIKMQRVVFVNRYFYPDVSATSQILWDLAQGLRKQGMEVHVVCCRQLYEDSSSRLSSRETIGGVQVHRIWTTRFGRAGLAGRAFDYLSFYLFAAAKLLGTVGKHDVLVAKTDPPLISLVAAAIAAMRGAHLINWLQDVFPEIASQLGANPLPTWLDAALRRMRARSLAAASMNIVLGQRMRDHLLDQRVAPERIRVIENWADGTAIRPIPAEGTCLRKTLGLEGKFIVGYSGNMGRAHEFDTILGAATKLRARDDIVFVVIGGGAKMPPFKRAVQDRRLTNFVFLPYQPRELLCDSLAAADVHLACLLPPLEGLMVPSKFYGILAAGRPVIFIGDADGELARVIRASQCGSVVFSGDGAVLADEISRLSVEPAWRHAAGQRARELFDRDYTLEAATGKWLTVLQEC
jgi:colanic acid biosynthesis glycosyl transferase WcaI